MGKDDFVYRPGGGGGGGGGGGIDFQIGGNTTGTTALVSTGTLTLGGGNNVTLSQVGNGITISVPNTASQTVQTQNLFDLQIGGNTTGTTALVSSGTLTLAGGNNITLSQNGNAITIVGGAGAATQSFWNPYPNEGLTKVTVFGQSTVLFVPLTLPFNFSGSRANLFVSATVTTSAASSHAGTLSYFLGIYSLNVSTLSLASSGSVSFAWTVTSSNSSDFISDMKMFSLPININATSGQYWLAHLSMTASAGNNFFSLSNGMMNAAKLIGSFNSNNTVNMAPGWGHYSAASAALPSSENISKILGGAQFDVAPPIVNFMNFTG